MIIFFNYTLKLSVITDSEYFPMSVLTHKSTYFAYTLRRVINFKKYR